MYIQKNAGGIEIKDDAIRITRKVLDNLSGKDGSLVISIAMTLKGQDTAISLTELLRMDGDDDFTFEFEGREYIQPRLRIGVDTYEVLGKLGLLPEN